MVNTNPLVALNIKKLVGFKQITPGVIAGDAVAALKQCGINLVSTVTKNGAELSISQMTVLGNTFHGLKMKTERGKQSGYIYLSLKKAPHLLKERPIQIGFRMTQTAVGSGMSAASMIMIAHSTQIYPSGVATMNTEDTSAYYEMVFRVAEHPVYKTTDLYIDIYVNRQLVSQSLATYEGANDITMRLGASSFPDTDAGFNLMVGDVYIAELSPNSDGTVTPQLLGNLVLEPFAVESYSGDRHNNTKNQDIVTALNTLDPNNDMGVLALKPVAQAASVTFSPPDIDGKQIYGVSLNVVYKDSIAPNNSLSYQVTEGSVQLPAETISTHSTDVTGYTTFSKVLTTPEGGGDWNADTLKFKLDLMNQTAV